MGRIARVPSRLAFGNLTVSEGTPEERGIHRVVRQNLKGPLKVLSHLDAAFDREQHHRFEIARPFVPEESRTLVITDVDQRHRATIVGAP
jgi:hypothetical protein